MHVIHGCGLTLYITRIKYFDKIGKKMISAVETDLIIKNLCICQKVVDLIAILIMQRSKNENH